jgi:hypothetical protein
MFFSLSVAVALVVSKSYVLGIMFGAGIGKGTEEEITIF